MLQLIEVLKVPHSQEWKTVRDYFARYGRWIAHENAGLPRLSDSEFGLVFWDATLPIETLLELQAQVDGAPQWLGIVAVRTSQSQYFSDAQLEGLMEALSSGAIRDWVELPISDTGVLALLTRIQREESSRIAVGDRFRSVLTKIEADIQCLNHLQESLRPPPWIQLRGLEVYSRYVPGVKPGGNFFEVLECTGTTRSEDQVLVVLAETTSYGLSAQVTSLLLNVVSRWSRDDATADPAQLARRFLNEIYPLMQETDQVGVGVLAVNPSRGEMRSVCFGNMEVILLRGLDTSLARVLPNQGEGISKKALRAQKTSATGVIPGVAVTAERLEKDTRVILASSGLVNGLGGAGKVLHSVQRMGVKPASSLLTELTFHLHRDEADELPDRDATAIVLDFSPKHHLRVA